MKSSYFQQHRWIWGGIVLSKISEREEDKRHMISLGYRIKKYIHTEINKPNRNRLIDKENILMVAGWQRDCAYG